GVLIAVVVGAWQISLARKQVQLAQGGGTRAGPSATPAEAPGNSENLLHRLWESFDPALQEALSLAYNQAKREGKTRISTRTFSAAAARLRPGQLPRFLEQLPEGSLPEPVGEDVPREGPILQEDPQLSPCVESTLSHLGKTADPLHKLSTA